MSQWNQDGILRYDQVACVEEDQEKGHSIRSKMHEMQMGYNIKGNGVLSSQTGNMQLQSNPWSGFHGELLTSSS